MSFGGPQGRLNHLKIEKKAFQNHCEKSFTPKFDFSSIFIDFACQNRLQIDPFSNTLILYKSLFLLSKTNDFHDFGPPKSTQKKYIKKPC